jgi:serine/threonine protein kinase
LEGETLYARLARKPLAPEETLKIAIEIADALEKAHRSGIVHRDLKPGNVMLTKSGAKLMDFGLAKPFGLGSGPKSGSASMASVATMAATMADLASPVTVAGTIVGTVQYMSPEQIQGKEADARSDIFAFGALLYEMLTGKRAFEGKSQLSLASAILEKDPEPISVVRPLTPPALEHIVRTLPGERARRSLPKRSRSQAAIAMDRRRRQSVRHSRSDCLSPKKKIHRAHRRSRSGLARRCIGGHTRPDLRQAAHPGAAAYSCFQSGNYRLSILRPCRAALLRSLRTDGNSPSSHGKRTPASLEERISRSTRRS